MEQLALAVRLRERARFENFLAGPNNEALALARSVAAGRPGVALLTGPVATGKSHLLLAAANEARRSGRRATYVALRELAAAGAASLSGQGGAEVICCDDVDAIAGDAEFGRALFQWWREVEERGSTLVFAARAVPALSDWALADFGSRLRGVAMRAQLQTLDEPTQGQVLELRARGLGLELPHEVIEFLQRRLPRDLATQCAFVEELDLAALAAQRRLTVPFVREVLAQRGLR